MKPRIFSGILLAILAITALRAAPVTFAGSATLTLRPDPANPGLTFDANTFNNELIFIITDDSNSSLKITNIFDPTLTLLDKNPTALVDPPLEISDANPCKGAILKPLEVCAFSVLFDTSGPNDGASNQWQIGEQISVLYYTQTPMGKQYNIPSAVPVNNPLKVKVTVQNATLIGFDPSPSAVPEPGTLLSVGLVLFGGMICGLIRVIRRRFPGPLPGLFVAASEELVFLAATGISRWHRFQPVYARRNREGPLVFRPHQGGEYRLPAPPISAGTRACGDSRFTV
jgi:hypothetical protein